MTGSKKKQTSKALAQTKRRRRRVLTFWRMVRYGINNFSRNAWLTIAATAVMTITLLIIFGTVITQDVLNRSVSAIQDSVSMSIYVQPDTSTDTVDRIKNNIKQLESVKDVSIVTPEQARDNYIEENKSDPKTLKALNNSDPHFPITFRVKMADINNVDELKQFVDSSETLEGIMTDKPPSYDGKRRDAIKQIGEWARFADRAGTVVGVVFVVISSLIIFNTIRMAIFNRQEEIQMMKLIGAERSFIRGPFVVEAVVYGFIAALLATGLGVFAIYSAQHALEDKGIMVTETANWLVAYSPIVLLIMIMIGALIGVISSLFAARRYLKL